MSMGGVTVEGSSSSRVAAGNQASQTRPSHVEKTAENPVGPPSFNYLDYFSINLNKQNVLPLTHLKEASVFIPHQQQQLPQIGLHKQPQSGSQQQPPLPSHSGTVSLLKNIPLEHRKSIIEETLKNYFASKHYKLFKLYWFR
jgi:hypothetical protein